jgi:hypothetical protein
MSGGFIDYSKFCYCRSCKLKVPKELVPKDSGLLRCPSCNRQIHTRKKNKLRNQKVDTRIRVA